MGILRRLCHTKVLCCFSDLFPVPFSGGQTWVQIPTLQFSTAVCPVLSLTSSEPHILFYKIETMVSASLSGYKVQRDHLQNIEHSSVHLVDIW